MKPIFRPSQTLIPFTGAVALFVSIALYKLNPAWRWHYEPLHSAMEAIGGLAAIAMGLVLVQKPDPEGVRWYPVAAGFLGMGVIEEFHAVAGPGNGFILLRNVASLVGGIGFALVWLPISDPVPLKRTAVIYAVTAVSIAFGAWALAFPGHLPLMIRDDVFTPTAVAPQSLACLLFLVSAARFAAEYRRAGRPEEALFASLAMLFALAEIMFIYSTLWDSRWWFWHGIRLTAYLLVLSSVVREYRKMVVDLKDSLVQTTWAEEAARRSEQQLREALDRRERMAQDLHDGVIQSLFALGLNLERCQRLVSHDPQEAIHQLGQSLSGLKGTIRDLRGYIFGLEPSIAAGRNLQAVLMELARTVERSADLQCQIEIDDAAANMVTTEQATHVLHIVREALSNSLRHANARHEIVALRRQDKGIRLSVEDDGTGFDPASVGGGGEGLKNMAARAKQLGAKFEIRSRSGQGTRIVFDLPVERVHV